MSDVLIPEQRAKVELARIALQDYRRRDGEFASEGQGSPAWWAAFRAGSVESLLHVIDCWFGVES